MDQKSEALTVGLTGRDDRQLVSSWLLHTEMHCAAGLHPEDIDLEAIRIVLDSVSLVDLTRGDLLAAGTHARLRSNDAIHLAVALRVGADEIVTYNEELAERGEGSRPARAVAGNRRITPSPSAETLLHSHYLDGLREVGEIGVLGPDLGVVD